MGRQMGRQMGGRARRQIDPEQALELRIAGMPVDAVLIRHRVAGGLPHAGVVCRCPGIVT